jgi:hypothetical protein
MQFARANAETPTESELTPELRRSPTRKRERLVGCFRPHVHVARLEVPGDVESNLREATKPGCRGSMDSVSAPRLDSARAGTGSTGLPTATEWCDSRPSPAVHVRHLLVPREMQRQGLEERHRQLRQKRAVGLASVTTSLLPRTRTPHIVAALPARTLCAPRMFAPLGSAMNPNAGDRRSWFAALLIA